MGYDLHITRKSEWNHDNGPIISAEEWRKVVSSDSDLKVDQEDAPGTGGTEIISASFRAEFGVFNWENGEIWTKNPEQETVKKAVQIANCLAAQAQGDDGEVYGPDGEALLEEPIKQSTPARVGLLSRIARWFRHRRVVKELQKAAPPFKAGDHICDPWGSIGTILEVDALANHGLGHVRVRMDD